MIGRCRHVTYGPNRTCARAHPEGPHPRPPEIHARDRPSDARGGAAALAAARRSSARRPASPARRRRRRGPRVLDQGGERPRGTSRPNGVDPLMERAGHRSPSAASPPSSTGAYTARLAQAAGRTRAARATTTASPGPIIRGPGRRHACSCTSRTRTAPTGCRTRCTSTPSATSRRATARSSRYLSGAGGERAGGQSFTYRLTARCRGVVRGVALPRPLLEHARGDPERASTAPS